MRRFYELSRNPKPPFSLMGAAAPRGAQDKIAWAQEDIKATEADAGAAADFAGVGSSALFGKR